MGYTLEILEEVRTDPRIQVTDDSLTEARERREAVKQAARSFPGVDRDYNSGSLAHRTATSTADGDCGIVLDRSEYPSLGPDSDLALGPVDIVEQVRAHVEEQLVEDWPNVRVTAEGKRSIVIEFNEPADGHGDPTVDLIVGIDREGEPGIWIPNLLDNEWNCSHPERHTELLTDDPAELRRMRARTIRVMKAQVRQFETDTLCSFNVAALALEAVTEDKDLSIALKQFLDHAAEDVAKQDTPDPAGVSPPIKLPLMRQIVVDRLERARDALEDALNNDDSEDVVRAALQVIFPHYLGDGAADPDADLKVAVRTGAGAAVTSLSGIEFPRKTTRAYGVGPR